MPFLSKHLNRILDFNRSFEEEIDLGTLCQPIAEAFGPSATLAEALLKPAKGKMTRGALGLHLLQILKHDSAVRDVQTTGHLAKFLSRLEVFQKTLDYRLIGLPNSLFDGLSQLERTRYFEGGTSLELEEEALESAQAKNILKRESAIFLRFSSPKKKKPRTIRFK